MQGLYAAAVGDARAGVFKPWPMPGDVIHQNPKDWDGAEAGAGFAHRELLPKLRGTVESAVANPRHPGVVLSGPPGVGKSGLVRVLSSRARSVSACSCSQRLQWLQTMVVYVAHCDYWCNPATNPWGYFLDRATVAATEGVRAFQAAGGNLGDLVDDLGKLVTLAPPPKESWNRADEASTKQLCTDVIIALGNGGAKVKTLQRLLVFDEVNKIVELDKLDTAPFSVAQFLADIASGCRLVSGTPLHSYIQKLSAGYRNYASWRRDPAQRHRARPVALDAMRRAGARQAAQAPRQDRRRQIVLRVGWRRASPAHGGGPRRP